MTCPAYSRGAVEGRQRQSTPSCRVRQVGHGGRMVGEHRAGLRSSRSTCVEVPAQRRLAVLAAERASPAPRRRPRGAGRPMCSLPLVTATNRPPGRSTRRTSREPAVEVGHVVEHPSPPRRRTTHPANGRSWMSAVVASTPRSRVSSTKRSDGSVASSAAPGFSATIRSANTPVPQPTSRIVEAPASWIARRGDDGRVTAVQGGLPHRAPGLEVALGGVLGADGLRLGQVTHGWVMRLDVEGLVELLLGEVAAGRRSPARSRSRGWSCRRRAPAWRSSRRSRSRRTC